MIVVAFTTTTLVAATPLTFTLVAPMRFVPVIVIGVPPADGPTFGLTAEIVGGRKYVNGLGAIATPADVVTATLAAPTVPAGVTAVISVAFITTTLVAETPPTFTLVAPARKFVPTIVIAVAPAVGPTLGFTDVIVGINA